METIDITTVKPAEYNPRKLSPNAFEDLKNSIRTLGVIKPIIVRKENNTIIAGHQRTKTMLSLGIKHAPAFILEGVNLTDEVRFNQLHNRCEYEVNEKAPKVKINAPLEEGFNRIANKDITIIDKGELPILNNLLCSLIVKYGEFGCPISDLKGDVGISSAYAFACKHLGKDIYVYALPKEKYKTALSYFSKTYGQFSYDNLKRNTYIQALAQMKRLRDGKKGVANSMKSTLYREKVIPYLQANKEKNLKILDFGAGQKDYAKMLKKQGYDILAVEPYHLKEGTRTIDVLGNKRDFLQVCEDLKTFGGYDVVICDSVLNSVDSIEAERSVIYTVLALCKVGGKIFMSGRPKSDTDRKEIAKNATKSMPAYIHFFDENNFSALYRNGQWFYQKFHSDTQIKEIAQTLSDRYKTSKNHSSFHIVADKIKECDENIAIASLRFEWDMMLPNNKSYGLSDEIENAYRNKKKY